MKRTFQDYIKAEDFVNELVFGGDDPKIVGELVEVWRDEEHFNDSYTDPDNPEKWGVMYAVWGTEEELEAEVVKLGEYIDRKGITGRADEEDDGWKQAEIRRDIAAMGAAFTKEDEES